MRVGAKVTVLKSYNDERPTPRHAYVSISDRETKSTLMSVFTHKDIPTSFRWRVNRCAARIEGVCWYKDENITWMRGWVDQPAVDALLAANALGAE